MTEVKYHGIVTEKLASAGGAYYDSKVDEIHILVPQLLYQLTLAHERVHARKLKTTLGRLCLFLLPVHEERVAWREAFHDMTKGFGWIGDKEFA